VLVLPTCVVLVLKVFVHLVMASSTSIKSNWRQKPVE
jgi:hypothetical protein